MASRCYGSGCGIQVNRGIMERDQLEDAQIQARVAKAGQVTSAEFDATHQLATEAQKANIQSQQRQDAINAQTAAANSNLSAAQAQSLAAQSQLEAGKFNFEKERRGTEFDATLSLQTRELDANIGLKNRELDITEARYAWDKVNDEKNRQLDMFRTVVQTNAGSHRYW